MYLLLAIHIAWTLGAVPLVTRQKRLPASAAAWLALILLLPVAGTLLYILAVGKLRNHQFLAPIVMEIVIMRVIFG